MELPMAWRSRMEGSPCSSKSWRRIIAPFRSRTISPFSGATIIRKSNRNCSANIQSTSGASWKRIRPARQTRLRMPSLSYGSDARCFRQFSSSAFRSTRFSVSLVIISFLPFALYTQPWLAFDRRRGWPANSAERKPHGAQNGCGVRKYGYEEFERRRVYGERFHT